ncbi:MAG TPA: hypothetical protein VLX08_07370 [Steroidobacteraceae bacterium]|nr:hypothetical protein [Steroidobacteraceae bacterium]
MKDIVRLFAQIALLRRGPQDLPASELLLALTVLGYFCVNFVLSSVLPPDAHWRGPLLIDTVFTLLWYVALLRFVGRPERILQTTTAVFGFQAVLSPLLIASEWLMRRVSEDTSTSTSSSQVLVTCVGLLLLAWLIAANSHVVKAALEWSVSASVALVILQMLVGWLVVSAVFSPVKA